jgi:hypothetical protein
MRARFTTLVGMDHVAGVHGPLPRTVLTHNRDQNDNVSRLFESGFQTVLVITVNDKTPTVLKKSGRFFVVQ